MFHVSVQTVRKVISSRYMLSEQRNQEHSDKEKCSDIIQKVISLTNEILDTKRGIISVPKIAKELRDHCNIDISNHLIRKILREEMGLKWKKIVHQADYINSEINIQRRYQFAIELCNLLKAGKIIINYDESLISGTCSKAYSWERRKNTPGRVIKRTLTGISILLSVSSDGIKFF